MLAATLLSGCGSGSSNSTNRVCSGGQSPGVPPSATYLLLKQDVLTNADYWENAPRVLAAGLGFTDILGVPGLSASDLGAQRQAVLAAGGAWNIVMTSAASVTQRAYTSAASPSGVANSYGWQVQYCDGLPIEFSWPVLPSTLDAKDFRVHLNDGSVVTPRAVSINPNLEYNERSTVVILGGFGNRIPPGEPGARYPVLFEIVPDETPLELVGPGGQLFSAVGLTFGDGTTPRTAYEPGKGPILVAAKLSRMSTAGEGGPALFNTQIPNDGVALYGPDATYRLRVLTTGGFSPDGVRSVYPTEFSRYFRLLAVDAGGHVVAIAEANRRYTIDGASLTVLGLADLGLTQDSYDDAYIEDHDNQIDIVLSGDESAMRAIRMVEIPAAGDYSPFYNPGGPGNDPKPGTVYTEPGPLTQQPVTIALDDPMTVDWPAAP
ncbi:MAG: phospholipase [bacterium]